MRRTPLDLAQDQVGNRFASLFLRPGCPLSLHAYNPQGISRNSPDAGGFAASIVLLTGFGNGKSPSLLAKGDRDLLLRHSMLKYAALNLCFSCEPVCLSKAHNGVLRKF